MNLTNLAATLRDDMTTIVVNFITNEGVVNHREYTYKCDLETAKQLEEGDMVVVHAANSSNYKQTALARVVTVHEQPDVDLDNKITLKWVMCRVPYDETMQKQALDNKVGKSLRLQHANNCRDRALAMLGMSHDQAKMLLTQLSSEEK